MLTVHVDEDENHDLGDKKRRMYILYQVRDISAIFSGMVFGEVYDSPQTDLVYVILK